MWSILFVATAAAVVYYLEPLTIFAKQLLAHFLTKWLVNVRKSDYELSYPVGTRWYKVILQKSRRPFLLASITNAQGLDISKKILPYMGPGHDFNGIVYTPQMLGEERITITFGVPEITMSFKGSDPIILS